MANSKSRFNQKKSPKIIFWSWNELIPYHESVRTLSTRESAKGWLFKTHQSGMLKTADQTSMLESFWLAKLITHRQIIEFYWIFHVQHTVQRRRLLCCFLTWKCNRIQRKDQIKLMNSIMHSSLQVPTSVDDFLKSIFNNRIGSNFDSVSRKLLF